MNSQVIETFEQWWEAHGQFGRAGGGDYEKTFAFNAWHAALALSIPVPELAAPDGVIAGTTEWTKEGIPLPAPPAEAKP